MWPVTAQILCLFAQFLSYNLKALSSIYNYFTGVHTLHLLTGQQVPNLQDFKWKITVRGLKRKMKHVVKQASPVTPLILAQIHALLNFHKKVDTVFWATLLVGFFIMAGASNLVPVSSKKWSPIKQLSRSSILFNRKGMVVRIRWSKTIQYCQKVLETPVLAIPQSILCLVKVVHRLLKINKCSEGGPLFAINRSKVFTYNML